MTYEQFLKKINKTEEQAQELVNIDNVIDVEIPGTFLSYSNIHGYGVFSDGHQRGDYIGQASVPKGRTILGRYVNHSEEPNTIYEVDDNGYFAVFATKDIAPEEEITSCYWTTFKNGQNG